MRFKTLDREDILDDLLPISAIQDHLRLYDSAEDTALEGYRAAAVNAAEMIMNRAVCLSTIQASFENWKSRVQLPFGDMNSITTISAFNGTENVEIETTLYRANKVTSELILDGTLSGYSDFIITMTVGYPTANDVPKTIVQGMLQLIATWYENREDIANGISVTEIPYSHRYCFELYRIPAGG